MSSRAHEILIDAVDTDGIRYPLFVEYSRYDGASYTFRQIGNQKCEMLDTWDDYEVKGPYLPRVGEEDLCSFFNEEKTEAMDTIIIEADFPMWKTFEFEIVGLDYISGTPYEGYHKSVTPKGIISHDYNLLNVEGSLWKGNIFKFSELIAEVGPDEFDVFLKNVMSIPQTDEQSSCQNLYQPVDLGDEER